MSKGVARSDESTENNHPILLFQSGFQGVLNVLFCYYFKLIDLVLQPQLSCFGSLSSLSLVLF